MINILKSIFFLEIMIVLLDFKRPEEGFFKQESFKMNTFEWEISGKNPTL